MVSGHSAQSSFQSSPRLSFFVTLALPRTGVQQFIGEAVSDGIGVNVDRMHQGAIEDLGKLA